MNEPQHFPSFEILEWSTQHLPDNNCCLCREPIHPLAQSMYKCGRCAKITHHLCWLKRFIKTGRPHCPRCLFISDFDREFWNKTIKEEGWVLIPTPLEFSKNEEEEQ
jgi:hypothetical protein